MDRKRIAVMPPAELTLHSRLFRTLETLYPVDFVMLNQTPDEAYDGVILCQPSEAQIQRAREFSSACLILGAGTKPKRGVRKGIVEFRNTLPLDRAFRGRILPDESISEIAGLRPKDNDEIVCCLDESPYWVIRRSAESALSVVASSLPDFGEHDTIYHIFNRTRWLQFLPILHFLKDLTRLVDWEAPRLRACFIIDDPNLHWHRYGYLHFEKLVQHAKEHNYHVAVATVPVDTWFTHSRTAAYLRANAKHLSLMIHGNDHSPNELAMLQTDHAISVALAQALRRITNLERRTGLEVARVMAPPYGAVRDSAFSPLMRLGYEACCVSRSSLLGWNRHRIWSPSFGHPVVEVMDEGFPVIPRHVMGKNQEVAYCLAAFLNQPVIPHGHHEDCRSGFELFAHVAGIVNGLGHVRWSDIRSIARSNFHTGQIDGVPVIKMLSRKIELVLDNSTEIVVERPWLAAENDEELLFCTCGDEVLFAGLCGFRTNPISLPHRGMIELYSPSSRTLDFQQLKSSRLGIWPLARRMLSETRDRISPLVSKLTTRWTATSGPFSDASQARS